MRCRRVHAARRQYRKKLVSRHRLGRQIGQRRIARRNLARRRHRGEGGRHHLDLQFSPDHINGIKTRTTNSSFPMPKSRARAGMGVLDGRRQMSRAKEPVKSGS